MGVFFPFNYGLATDSTRSRDNKVGEGEIAEPEVSLTVKGSRRAGLEGGGGVERSAEKTIGEGAFVT